MTPDHVAKGPEAWLRQAQSELERRIHAGDDCRAEEFFARCPALAESADLAIDLIYAEFTARCDTGPPPDRGEYYRRFPAWRRELERQFAVDEVLQEPLEVRVLHITGADGVAEEYHVLSEVCNNRTGSVVKARHVRLDRVVAVKTCPAGDAADAAWFHAGAQAQARLQHPNILPVFAVGESAEGLPCFAMAFAEGGSLAQRIDGKPQPPAEAVRVVRTLAEAMGYAHDEGVVHRDLKPANVVLSADGTVQVTDFGLARRLDAPGGQSKTGDLLGTPPYMAPEQAVGRTRDVGPLSDVYALGAILYELLTGRPPFQGKTVVETLQHVVKRPPVRPRRLQRGVPRALESICLKCLEKRPRRRYASARALADDLRRWEQGQRPRAHAPFARAARFLRRHAVPVAVLAVLLTAAATASLAGYLSHPERAWERIARQLGENGEVTLIGATGPPSYRTWEAVGDGRQKEQLAADGTFQITSERGCLLCLVRDPQHPRYRLRATIRHDQSFWKLSSRVGVYFAYGPWTAADPDPCYGVVMFDGCETSMLPRGSPVEMMLCRLKAPESTVPRTAGRPAYIPVLWKAQPDWFQLTVDIAPEQVRIAICRDGDPADKSRTTEVSWQIIQKERAKLFRDVLAPDLADAYRGALGLYVVNGTASFRNVVVTPNP
jgi:serine/threonine-protein kinase